MGIRKKPVKVSKPSLCVVAVVAALAIGGTTFALSGEDSSNQAIKNVADVAPPPPKSSAPPAPRKTEPPKPKPKPHKVYKPAKPHKVYKDRKSVV